MSVNFDPDDEDEDPELYEVVIFGAELSALFGVRDRMCPSCPFRNDCEPQVQIGGKNPISFIDEAFGETGSVVCLEEPDGHGKVCSGAMQCASKSAKLFRHPEMAALQESVAIQPESMTRQQFLGHHLQIYEC